MRTSCGCTTPIVETEIVPPGGRGSILAKFNTGTHTGSHIGPVQASEVFARLGAAHGIGMHWGTFRLSYEAYDTPPKLLAAVMECRGLTGFNTVALGKPTEIEAYAPPKPPAATMDACRNRPDYAAFK